MGHRDRLALGRKARSCALLVIASERHYLSVAGAGEGGVTVPLTNSNTLQVEA